MAILVTHFCFCEGFWIPEAGLHDEMLSLRSKCSEIVLTKRL